MTPAVGARLEGSMSPVMSIECVDERLEYLDEREPAVLPGGARLSYEATPYPYPSRSSAGLSLYSFLPKKDFPADVCLDLSAGGPGGILACIYLTSLSLSFLMTWQGAA